MSLRLDPPGKNKHLHRYANGRSRQSAHPLAPPPIEFSSHAYRSCDRPSWKCADGFRGRQRAIYPGYSHTDGSPAPPRHLRSQYRNTQPGTPAVRGQTWHPKSLCQTSLPLQIEPPQGRTHVLFTTIGKQRDDNPFIYRLGNF